MQIKPHWDHVAAQGRIAAGQAVQLRTLDLIMMVDATKLENQRQIWKNDGWWASAQQAAAQRADQVAKKTAASSFNLIAPPKYLDEKIVGAHLGKVGQRRRVGA